MGFIVNKPTSPVRNTSATLISTNDVFEKGRVIIETDTNRAKVGDGVTAYVDLSYPEWTYEEVPVATGTNTYTATFSKDILLVYFNMMRLRVKFTNANTGAATINLNGLGAIPIRKLVSTPLASGDILAGGIYDLTYDGTNFQLLGDGSGAGGGVPPTRTLTIGGNSQDLSANRTWLWTPSKYHIESGESVTVPEKYQQLIISPLINEGTIINNGKIFNRL